MKTYPLEQARSEFSEIIEQALAGEPQRVARADASAVVIVSETAWEGRRKSHASLGALLADHARRVGFEEEVVARPWGERALGDDFE